jgi:hypothetical protein
VEPQLRGVEKREQMKTARPVARLSELKTGKFSI